MAAAAPSSSSPAEPSSGEPGTCWVNWAATQSARPAAILYPRSVEEVQAIVLRAVACQQRVKVVGAGHSPSAIARPDDGHLALSLRDLAAVTSIDAAAMTVTLEGGATLAAANAALAAAGLALENLPSISELTIAGVIQTGTHGTGARLGSLHTQVRAITAVNGRGEVRVVTRVSHPQLFRCHLVGLGALGVVCSVTLAVVPAFTLRETKAPATLQQVLDAIPAPLPTAHAFCKFLLYPFTGQAGIVTCDVVDPASPIVKPAADDTPSAVADLMAQAQTDALSVLGRPATSLDDLWELAIINHRYTARINLAVFRDEFCRSPTRCDISYNILNFNCGGKQYVMEASIPLAHGAAFLLELNNAIQTNGFPAHCPIEIRFVRADDAYLSPAYSTCVSDVFLYVGIIVYRPEGRLLKQDTLHTAYFETFQRLARAHRGRMHWAKLYHLELQQIIADYPDWGVFDRCLREEDPAGVFQNDYIRQLFGCFPPTK